MRKFMRPDEIRAFKDIFKNIKFEDEISIKEKLFLFMVLTFLYRLILKGSAYISTTIDPDYVPCNERGRACNYSNSSIIENAIILPSDLYLGYEFIIIFLSILGDILKRIKNRN